MCQMRSRGLTVVYLLHLSPEEVLREFREKWYGPSEDRQEGTCGQQPSGLPHHLTGHETSWTTWTDHRQSNPPLQRSHAEAPQPLLVLEEAAGAKRVQGVNYAYFGIRHQYLS
jgi:hypothetical protein